MRRVGSGRPASGRRLALSLTRCAAGPRRRAPQPSASSWLFPAAAAAFEHKSRVMAPNWSDDESDGSSNEENSDSEPRFVRASPSKASTTAPDSHKKASPAKTWGLGGSKDGAAPSDHGWLQRTFSRCAGLYRARGYAGNITVSGQLGFVTESIGVKFPLEEAAQSFSKSHGPSDKAADGSAPSGGGEDGGASLDDGGEEAVGHSVSRWLETGDARVARLLRGLVHRLEQRALAWEHVPGVSDPTLGCQGALGIHLPVVQIGWSVTIQLIVYKSTLLRWMEWSAQARDQQPASPDDKKVEKRPGVGKEK